MPTKTLPPVPGHVRDRQKSIKRRMFEAEVQGLDLAARMAIHPKYLSGLLNSRVTVRARPHEALAEIETALDGLLAEREADDDRNPDGTRGPQLTAPY